ncbi:MAG: hypothetical protein JW849_02260 [Phycisphaerae bacterium]|nr:hypothetical protein [Phycisphaerae bacterium]
MLAALGDYLKAWGPVLFLTLLIALLLWLVGGGYLFQRILGKRTERRRYSLGQGVLVSLLSGAGGGFAAFALYFIGRTIFPVEPDPMKLPICWIGVGLGIAGYLISAYLIVLAMHKLSVGETLKASFVPIVGPLLIGGVITGASFYFFSFKSVLAERRFFRHQSLTIIAVDKIYKSLERRVLQTGKATDSLETLVKENYLTPEDIQSPINSKGRGFFYTGERTSKNPNSQKILLCDYAENFGEKGRVVLYAGGNIEFLTPQAFQSRLDQVENRRFAKALEEAEKK